MGQHMARFRMAVLGAPCVPSQYSATAQLMLSAPSELQTWLYALELSLPAQWVAAAAQALAAGAAQPVQQPQPQQMQRQQQMLQAQAVRYMLLSIGWDAQGVAAFPQEDDEQAQRQHYPWVPPPFKAAPHIQLFTAPIPLSVKLGTRLQLSRPQYQAPRMEAWTRCVSGALNLHVGQQGGGPAGADRGEVQRAIAGLRDRLPRVWKLGWDSRWKETFWRLLLGGVVGAGGHGIALKRQPCPCGWQIPAHLEGADAAAAQRDHVFWHCQPARAVRALLQHNLPAGVQLQARHLWLLERPSEGIHAGVWAVVCMAALTAIARARACMWARHKAQQAQRAAGPRQRTLDELWGGARMPEHPADALLDVEDSNEEPAGGNGVGAEGQAGGLVAQGRGVRVSDLRAVARRQLSIPAVTSLIAASDVVSAVREFVDVNQGLLDWEASVDHPFFGVRKVVHFGTRYEVVSNLSVPLMGLEGA